MNDRRGAKIGWIAGRFGGLFWLALFSIIWLLAIVLLPIFFLKDVIGVLRLYHYQLWEICNADLDSLTLLADNIGLVMMYARCRNTVHAVAEIIGDTFHVELVPKKTMV